MELHRGRVVTLVGDPSLAHAAEALRHHADGGLLVDDDGRIAWCGPWDQRPRVTSTVVDHHGAFLLPGFVDTHLHFPQVYCADAYGGGSLLRWLDRVVFPAEARFADETYAKEAADRFCGRLVDVGTTTSLVFGSQFPHAQDALFEAAVAHGLRMVSGRTIMTVGPPSAAPLLTSEPDAVSLAADEIDRWHPGPGPLSRTGSVRVALVPRFALSVTATTLAALGELHDAVRARGVHVTTHLSESGSPRAGEIGAVCASYRVDSYLDVYDGRFAPGSRRGGSSLLGTRTVLAHAVHCSDTELDRIAAAGAAIAHCPVSQQFLGSGTMPWRRVAGSGATLSVGSDIAAGDEWFLPRVLNACFKSHMNAPAGKRAVVHPAQLLHAATLGGAAALGLRGEIGALEPGAWADFVVLDPGRCAPLALSMDRREPEGEPAAEAAAVLFRLLLGADERAVAGTWVGGRRLTPSCPGMAHD